MPTTLGSVLRSSLQTPASQKQRKTRRIIQQKPAKPADDSTQAGLTQDRRMKRKGKTGCKTCIKNGSGDGLVALWLP